MVGFAMQNMDGERKHVQLEMYIVLA